MSDRAAIVNRAHKLATDFPYLAENCLSILTKSGEQVRFRLNKAQRIVHERMEAQKRRTGKVRAIVLKARQWGCSTYVEGRFFGHCIMQSGVSSFILTHSNPATDNLFAMTRRFYDSLPPPLKPATIVSNVKELRFATDSGIAVATAGAKGAGRARTIQYLHGSEVAHWPNAAEHMAGLLQAVPDATGTEIVLESTAAGVGGLFYDMVKAAERGERGYELIFVPWFWHEEYAAEPPADWQLPEGFREYARVHELTPEQVHWAWRKNGELSQACGASPDEVCWLFRQEYPATADEDLPRGWP